MRGLGLFPCLLLVAAAPQSPDSKLREIIGPVSGDQMKRTVEKLVGFGTRHTLSSQTDPKRGIGAALDWTQGQFRSFGLQTTRPCDTVTGRRVPSPTRVCDMIAIQRGTAIVHLPIDASDEDRILWSAFDPNVVTRSRHDRNVHRPLDENMILIV